MKISEHNQLYNLQHSIRKVKKPEEVAEICLSCKGACKASKGLVRCGRKARVKWLT